MPRPPEENEIQGDKSEDDIRAGDEADLEDGGGGKKSLFSGFGFGSRPGTAKSKEGSRPPTANVEKVEVKKEPTEAEGAKSGDGADDHSTVYGVRVGAQNESTIASNPPQAPAVKLGHVILRSAAVTPIALKVSLPFADFSLPHIWLEFYKWDSNGMLTQILHLTLTLLLKLYAGVSNGSTNHTLAVGAGFATASALSPPPLSIDKGGPHCPRVAVVARRTGGREARSPFHGRAREGTTRGG